VVAPIDGDTIMHSLGVSLIAGGRWRRVGMVTTSRSRHEAASQSPQGRSFTHKEADGPRLRREPKPSH
jgi:hypothetical protein